MSVVLSERRGSLALITVDNPPVNALSQAVRSDLVGAVEEAERDDQVEVIVLVCAGRTFMVGADIREFDQPPKPPHQPDVIARIEACEKPVIAAIHGSALGGGLEVALGCHYRVALADARIGFPEVNLGLLPGATGTQRLPRVTGMERALDMMISGKPVGALDASESGLIDQLIEDSDLLEGAMTFAEALVRRGAGPRRIRELKVPEVDPEFFQAYRQRIARKTRGLMAPERIIQCAEAATQLSFDEAIRLERKHFLECKASEQSAALRHVFFAERDVAKVPGIPDGVAPREVKNVAVIGAGTMGAGVAYCCLGAGLGVVLLDNSDQGLAGGEKAIRKLFEGGVTKGRVSEADMEAGLARLEMTQDYDAVADVDLVIEAVFENMAIKEEVFAKLDSTCRDGAIFATNTSTLNVDQIAAATRRPRDVVGMHFFSPAHVMRLIEIVRGAATAPDISVTALALAKRLRKLGVVVGNCFGFVGNRMLYGYGREAQLLLLEGAAPEAIDGALYDWGMAMGPHAVGDLAGLDVGYKVRQERTDLPDDPRFYRVADALVALGRFGQKTGKGMYRYEPGSRSPLPDPEVGALIAREAQALGIKQREIGAQEIVERCIYALVVEGARILEEGISPRSGDIDVVWINGYGFPRHRGGPMHYADSVGLDKVYDTVCRFRERFGPMYWEAPVLLKELAESGGRFADV